MFLIETNILWNKMTALGLICSQYASRLQEQFYHHLCNWQLRHFKKTKGKLYDPFSRWMLQAGHEINCGQSKNLQEKKWCHQLSFFLLFVNNVSECVSYGSHLSVVIRTFIYWKQLPICLLFEAFLSTLPLLESKLISPKLWHLLKLSPVGGWIVSPSTDYRWNLDQKQSRCITATLP